MKSNKNRTANFYSIEMNKTGEELVICYWCFDTLKAAKTFLNGLKNGCTAQNVTLSLYDAKQNLIEAWAIGDEYQASKRL